jgi:hypothetical protein
MSQTYMGGGGEQRARKAIMGRGGDDGGGGGEPPPTFKDRMRSKTRNEHPYIIQQQV